MTSKIEPEVGWEPFRQRLWRDHARQGKTRTTALVKRSPARARAGQCVCNKVSEEVRKVTGRGVDFIIRAVVASGGFWVERGEMLRWAL